MTDVGSVSVGVDVNGTGLGEKLAAQIRAAVLPVIAELNRELDGANGRIKNLDSGGVNKLVGSMRAAAASVHDLRDGAAEASTAIDRINSAEVRKLAQAARTAATAVKDVGQNATASARLTSLAADKMVRDYDRVGNAAERSADRQVAAAAKIAAANEAASRAGNRGGGGGGGGGRGGSGRGGGLTGSGGIASFLTSPVGLNAVALGSTAVGPALLGITNLTGAVQQLGQAGLLLPGVFAAAGSSFGVLKLGISGLTDAYKSFDTTLGPVAMKKAKAAFDALTPTAKELLTTVHDLSPALTDLKATASNAIFDGISQPLRDTVNKDLPLFKAGAAQIGAAWNGTLKSILSAVGSDSTGGFLTRIFGNTAQAQAIANAAIAPIVHAFGTLAATGTDFLPKLASGLDGLATRFDNFITKSAANGDLDRWIQEGIDAATRLGDTFLNIGKIVTDITKAAGGDGGFLKALDDGSTALHNFLSSADGQNKLKDFFASAREEWNQWKPILLDLGKAIPQVFAGLHDWGSVLLPIFGGITDFLTSVPGLISGLVTGLVGLRTLGGIAGLLDIGAAKAGMLGLPGVAETAAGGIKSAFMRVGLGALLGGAGLSLGTDLLTPKDENGNPVNPSGLGFLGGAAANIGGGAAAGAAFGSIVPGVGTGIGALIGGTVGALKTLFETVNQAIEANTAAVRKIRDAADTPENQAKIDAANKGIGRDRVLQPSLNAPTISASLVPKIRAGQVPGFAVNADGQVVNTTTGQVVPLPGNLTTVPPGAPPLSLPPARAIPPGVTPTIAPGNLNELLGPGTPTWQAGRPAVNIDSQAIEKTKNALNEIKTQVAQGFNGAITLTDPTPAIIARLRDLGVKITQLPDGKFTVDPVGLDAAVSKASNLNAQLGAFAGKTFTAQVQVSGQVSVPNGIAGPGGSPTPHRADGGVFPGYAPGVDSIWAKYSPGEGTLIPEAVRAVGGARGVYAINSRFRSGLSRSGYAGYADGGVTPGGLPGLDPGAPIGDPVVGLLTQIRDLLAGRGGTDSPLKRLAANTDKLPGGAAGLTSAGSSAAGETLGPFGTPIKPHNEAYDAAAAAIRSWGGDPEKLIGSDPTLTATTGLGGAGGLASPDSIAALTQFAQTGIAGPGVDITSPQAKAILAARNKKKGGLGDDQIAGLVNSTLTTGTFSGQLDATNTPLIEALLRPARGGTRATGITGAGLPGAITTSPIAGAGIGQGTAGITPVFVVNFPGQAVTDIPGLPGGANSALQTGSGAAAGPGGATNFAGKSIVDAATGAAGGVASDLTGSFIDAVASGTDFKIGTPAAASTSLSKLIQQGNPLAGAAAFGLNVPDFTRAGGTNGTVGQQGQKFDAKGRMYSDSGSLIDRTMTDLSAQIKASFDQLKSVINQVKDNTAKEVLEPLMKTAVTEGIAAMSNATNKMIGTAQGEAAAPPIADAVSKVASGAYQSGVSAGAAQSSSGTGLSGAAGGVLGNLFDEGGLWESGTYGTNLSGSVERVLNPVQTQLFDAGMLGGWAQQPQQQHQAAAAGVDATSTVGADFFGVSQIPILGAIINLFIGVLLKLIGVQIDARNTLTDIGKDAREFRGAFQKFDATGRLINDTSAISDRSSTSDQEAADERIRILKIVIEGLIKFIIEKIIIPIGQAVANAAISAGGAAAGAAVNSSAPGAGGIVSALIDSGGQAGVGIVADLATSFTEAATPVLTDSLFGAFQSLLPGASTSLFGGGLLSAITGPLQGLLSPLTGGIAGLFATLLGGLTFDEGGVASGVGLMPKATIRPERVLSPSQTQSFDRLVAAYERGNRGGNQVTVHAPFTVAGGAQGAEQAHAKLLSLLGGV